MDLFIHKLVTLSPRKLMGLQCAELHMIGTTLKLPFLPDEENRALDAHYAVPIKDIKAEIAILRKNVGVVIIKGGEPCIQHQALISLFMHIKNLGMKTALETYGTRPALLDELLKKKLVDVLVFKAYTPLRESWLKRTQQGTLLSTHKDTIENITQSIKLATNASCKPYARTIIVPGYLYRIPDIAAIIQAYSNIPRLTYELIPFRAPEGGKRFSSIKNPSDEFMDKLRRELRQQFPELNLL